MSVNKGGQAFAGSGCIGMYLIDYFAAHATIEDIKRYLPGHYFTLEKKDMSKARAKAKYAYAADMVLARNELFEE